MTTPRTDHLRLFAHSAASAEVMAVAMSHDIALPDDSAQPLPSEIVWMPVGRHAISAGTADGGTFQGTVICDEQAFRAVVASQQAIEATGRRVWLDFNHEEREASAWVDSFSWDPARGIVAHLKWTASGEQALRGRDFRSFSPAFACEQSSGRVRGLLGQAHSAGGLVNSQAFDAMPALVAARMSGAANHKPAPGGPPEQTTAMKDILMKLLAALKIQTPADATEEQLVALLAKHQTDSATAAALATEQVAALKKELAEVTAKATSAAQTSETVKAVQAKIVEIEAGVAAVRVGSATVTQTDLTDVLAAYAAKDPAQLPANERFAPQRADLALERAMIFARDIAPRIAMAGKERAKLRSGLADVLVHARDHTAKIISIAAKAKVGTVDIFAANSLGTLSGSLITQQSLSLLKAELPALGMFTTDFSNAAAKLNQTIITRVRAIPTEQTFVPANGYVSQDANTTDIPVTIDSHRYVQFNYNVNELASTNRDLFGEQAEGACYALCKGTVDAVLALFTLANYDLAAQKSIVAVGNWNRAALIAQIVALRKRKVYLRDACAIMNEDYFGALSSDAAIVSLAAFQRPEIITDYVLPNIAGVHPMGYVDLPTTDNLVALVAAKEAAVIATRLPYDYVDAQAGSNYGTVSQITSPELGLSVMLTQYVSHDAGASRYRVALMRGVAKGHTTRAQLVVSA